MFQFRNGFIAICEVLRIKQTTVTAIIKIWGKHKKICGELFQEWAVDHNYSRSPLITPPQKNYNFYGTPVQALLASVKVSDNSTTIRRRLQKKDIHGNIGFVSCKEQMAKIATQ